jgi:hypothetical protein
LYFLAQVIRYLVPPPTTTPTTSLMLDPLPSTPPTTNPTIEPKPPRLLSTLSREAIIILMHHVGVDLPLFCPCDTANGSDTKTHWKLEEIHCIMGCRKFWNYKDLIQVSCDGKWLMVVISPLPCIITQIYGKPTVVVLSISPFFLENKSCSTILSSNY